MSTNFLFAVKSSQQLKTLSLTVLILLFVNLQTRAS